MIDILELIKHREAILERAVNIGIASLSICVPLSPSPDAQVFLVNFSSHSEEAKIKNFVQFIKELTKYEQEIFLLNQKTLEGLIPSQADEIQPSFYRVLNSAKNLMALDSRPQAEQLREQLLKAESMLDRLPEPLLYNIASCLDFKSLAILAQVSKKYYKIAQPSIINKKIEKAIQKYQKDITSDEAALFAMTELGLTDKLAAKLREGVNVNAKLYLDKKNDIYVTPVHIAAYSGHKSCLTLLLNHGAILKPQQPCQYYLSPLHYAATAGRYDCLQFLLDQGIPIDQQSTISCPFGWNWTALQMAANSGYTECVSLLIQAGADINFKDPDGYQAIHRACMAQSVATLDLLLKKGANPDAVNSDDVTPLQIIVQKNNVECLQCLLKYPISTANQPSTFNQNLLPLQIAIIDKPITIAKILLEYDSQLVNGAYLINSETFVHPLYPTPMHIAVECENLEAVELLLEYKADTTIKSHFKKTALDLAKEKNYQAIIEAIEKYNDSNHQPYKKIKLTM